MATTTLMFLFIEQKNDRAERLQENVTALQLPANFHVKIVGGTSFEQGSARTFSISTAVAASHCHRRSPSSIRSDGPVCRSAS